VYIIHHSTASFALRKFKKKDIRKGMVLVSPAMEPRACWEFEGEILVLHHPTTISVRYQAMVHCGPIRQTATIIAMSTECLRTGDKALCRFRFIKYPEYLRIGTRLVFREGRTKAVGTVTQVFPHVSAVTAAAAGRSQHAKKLHAAETAATATGEQSSSSTTVGQPQQPSSRPAGRTQNGGYSKKPRTSDEAVTRGGGDNVTAVAGEPTNVTGV